jgi:hypothetical protein
VNGCDGEQVVAALACGGMTAKIIRDKLWDVLKTRNHSLLDKRSSGFRPSLERKP